MPGFSVGKAEDKLGICASSTCPLSFDQVKVHSLSTHHCSVVIASINSCYRGLLPTYPTHHLQLVCLTSFD